MIVGPHGQEDGIEVGESLSTLGEAEAKRRLYQAYGLMAELAGAVGRPYEAVEWVEKQETLLRPDHHPWDPYG